MHTCMHARHMRDTQIYTCIDTKPINCVGLALRIVDDFCCVRRLVLAESCLPHLGVDSRLSSSRGRMPRRRQCHPSQSQDLIAGYLLGCRMLCKIYRIGCAGPRLESLVALCESLLGELAVDIF